MLFFAVLIALLPIVIYINRKKKQATANVRILMEIREALVARLAQVRAEKDDLNFFTELVLHDLKTPLRFMMMRAQQMADEIERNEITILERPASDMIVEAAGVYHLALDMLRVLDSRKHNGRPSAQLVDLSVLMNDLVLIYGRIAAANGNTLEFNIPNPLEVVLPYELVKVIVRNLIDNAIRFTKNGRILVSTVLKERQLLIVVEDNGVGMDEQMVRMLMNVDAKKELPVSRSFGIGYTIIHILLQRMKGRLDIASSPERGTTVTVTLPVQNNSI